MKLLRHAAVAFLVLAAATCVFAGLLAPSSATRQFRDQPDAAPSRQHLLGTDDLGRDRLARVLEGTRVSLALAPCAALLTTLLAALLGGTAGLLGGAAESAFKALADLFLSTPWLFVLITVRALLPLNVAPLVSVIITFGLLGCLGWAGSARVVCATVHQLAQSEMILLAHASGSSNFHLIVRHILPNLKSVLVGQFVLSIPAYILAEANLGMLGLGVAEPMPSWGGLLRELESYSGASVQPVLWIPLVLLILTVGALQTVLDKPEAAS